MSLLTISWSMVSSVGFLLGAIHLMIWLRDRRHVAYLLAAIMASAAGVLALIELALMTSATPAGYQKIVLWNNIAIFAILVPMTWFVYVYLGTARRWLAIAITVSWTVCLLVNFVMPGNLTFSSVTALDVETSFWGEPFVVAEGVENPFKIVADITSLLIMIYVADASIRAFRLGLQRKAIVIGGSILFFIVVAGVHTPLVDAGIIRTPFLISFSFIAISFAMTVELIDQVSRAAVYSRKLTEWERKWSSLLNSVHLAVVGLDREGRINYVNPFFSALIGLPEEQLVDRPATSLAPSSELARFRRWLDGVPKKSVGPAVRFPIETVSGERRDLDWSTVPLRDADGTYDGLLSIGEDITDYLQSQDELHRSRQEMEHLTRAIILGELGSALAHELNQPLAAILANAQAAQRLLKSEAADLGEIREILADIVADDKRAGAVIDRMRRMLSSGDVANEAFDLNAAIREVLDLVEGERKKREVAIEFKPARGRLALWGGRIEIQQVMMNLVLNGMTAVCEHPPGDRRIRIATSRADHTASVTVEDSGPGVPEDIAQRIFEPFVTTKDAGLGMGLAISRRIVEAHGGHIGQASSILGGARFEVSLPLREAGDNEPRVKVASHA